MGKQEETIIYIIGAGIGLGLFFLVHEILGLLVIAIFLHSALDLNLNGKK